MKAPRRTQQDTPPSNQRGTEAFRDLPLLLSLIEQTEDHGREQDPIADLASAVNGLVEQRLPITTVSLSRVTEEAGGERVFADQASAELMARLQQGFRRLLLVPWGSQQRMGSLLELARRALSTASREPVSLAEKAVPHVHVCGRPRGAQRLRGVRQCAGAAESAYGGVPRLGPHLGQALCGDVRIVILRTSERTEQPQRSAGWWERPAIKALTAALVPQRAGFMTAGERSRWQRDGEIYARYLAALLCAAAADFLMWE